MNPVKIQARFGTYHSGLNDSASVDKQLMGEQPERLNRQLIQLAGSAYPSLPGVGQDNSFPLTSMTEGIGAVEFIKGKQYIWSVQEPQEHYVAVSSTTYVTGDKPGVGGGKLYVQFPENYFVKGSVLTNYDEVHCLVTNITALPSNYEYELQVVSGDPSVYVPLTSLAPGAKWAEMYTPEGEASTGKEGNLNFSYIDQKQYLTTLRKGYSYTGDVENKVVMFDLINESTGSKMTIWQDFLAWQHMMKWNMELETVLKYGQASYNALGLTKLKNDGGYPIHIGPGLYDQIEQKQTYGAVLTAQNLKNIMGDLFYGMTDGTNRVIDIYTGEDGIEAFDAAMKSEVAGAGWIKNTDPKSFIGGSGDSLTYGGFFAQYNTSRLGRTINVIWDKSLDVGPVAQIGPKNPLTGRPLESSRMIFVDRTLYDGKPNLVMVKRQGSEKRWAVAGGADAPKSFGGGTGLLRASDSDTASVHYMTSKGIVLLRRNTSLDLKRVF